MHLDTLKNLIEFTIQNKRGWAFKDFSNEDIITDVFNAYNSCRLLYASDGSRITGVCIFTTRPNEFYINQILVSCKEAFRSLMRALYSIFGEIAFPIVTFKRRFKTVSYNTKQMKHLLLKEGKI